MLFLIILGIMILILLVYVFITYNQLVNLQNMVKESFADMDIYLKKRWNLIPNLVQVVKEYTEYENTTFNQLILLKNYSYDKMQMKEKINVNERLTEEISAIKKLSEKYPKLKKSHLFLDFISELTEIEDEIVRCRKHYNGAVSIFNDKIQMFPANIIANFFGMEVAIHIHLT